MKQNIEQAVHDTANLHNKIKELTDQLDGTQKTINDVVSLNRDLQEKNSMLSETA